ncbi:MAG TPA: flagellar basal body P-ring formation chaperone FlgA [Kofleriaceae bacterium]|jgi:flagella basal body P-ring formation protein FlgA
MRSFVQIVSFIVLLSSAVQAAPVEDAIHDQVSPALPAGTDIAKIYMPASLTKLDVDPANVIVEIPRVLGVGRKSVKVTVAGRSAVFVPVAIAKVADVAIADHALTVGQTVTDADVHIETIAIEGIAPAAGGAVIGSRIVKPVAAGKAVGAQDIALPPPLPRGTQVQVEIRRGQVLVKGQGTLELVARPGEQATVRLAQNNITLRGTLVAPGTVVVGGI